MVQCTIILFLLAILKEASTSVTSSSAGWQQRSGEAVSLQIQGRRPAAEAAAALAGNNLNTVAANAPAEVPKNFRAISDNYSLENWNGNKELKGGLNDKSNFDQRLAKNPLRLVWDNCRETVYKDSRGNLAHDVKHDLDMEEAHRENQGDIMNKRDANKISSESYVKKLLDKHNNADSVSTEKKRQPKTEIIQRKTTEPPDSTVQVFPITEILNKSTALIDIAIDFKVTENNIEASYTEDWFERSDKPKIRFGGLPQKETYLIPSLRLNEGFYPFGFMSEFFALIHPFDFPIGLIKDIVWGKFTFPYSFLHSIKVESAFLVFIIVFGCVALIIPAYLLTVALLALLSRAGNNDMETGALFPELEETKCNDRVLAVVTLFVVLLCCIFVSGMAVSNEQAAQVARDSRNALSCACADIATWLSSAARELHHSLIPPVDLVLQAFRDDLRDIEQLLGDSIQKTIASESGIDLVLDSLNDVISESEEISSKISLLRDTTIQAGTLASVASDRFKDLAMQLENVKKHCLGKDIKLCDTINVNALQLRMKFDLILHEQQLLELRALGIENLTRAIAATKQQFRTLPSSVAAQTLVVRQDILRVMEARRDSIYKSSRILSDIVRHLTVALHAGARSVEAGLVRFQDYDAWRWALMLACIVTFSMVIIIIILAMLCGCSRAKGHAKRTLKFSTFWICFASFILWSVISAVFLIAGHAEVYVCHALWDSPQYVMLSNLLDKPSPLLPKDEGIFDSLFMDLENITIDVSVRDVLRDCERNHPAYTVFQLDKVFDVNKETSYFEWRDLERDLGRLSEVLDIDFLKTVSADLSAILNKMLLVSDVDLATYRMEYNGPVSGKDLSSLAEQLDNVGAQVTDLTTSQRLETLASRTHRLQMTNVKPLEQYRADIVYKLTELELQLLPFRRKLNISLSHIHTAQYYIDNQGDVIAGKKVSIYTNRLISHVAGWRTHVLSSVATHAAKCRPLFAVYSATRSLICSRYVASLHGWWMCGLFLGITWCGLTPLCVRLWRVYGRGVRQSDAINLANLTSGHQETPTTALIDSNWNTPGPGPPPPRSDSW